MTRLKPRRRARAHPGDRQHDQRRSARPATSSPTVCPSHPASAAAPATRGPATRTPSMKPRHDQRHHPHEQHVRQGQHQQRIPERQPDRGPGLGIAANVSGQALERDRQPARPRPGLDDRAVKRRDRPASSPSRASTRLSPRFKPLARARVIRPSRPRRSRAATSSPRSSGTPASHQRRDLFIESQAIARS